ncbi:unnamed protein product [Rotaria sordida]|uniref:Uncharacterized protein n=1 Tax=Rotaria sordida TaxID=392033 RepID=A0A819BYF5_9BILA|nr:unnamed protein product [Rotaria sordida]CAF3766481.1 unnamed protein product [Rotaria sordida]CAF3809827.1 unnamed protein product [Rotaria sordida]
MGSRCCRPCRCSCCNWSCGYCYWCWPCGCYCCTTTADKRIQGPQVSPLPPIPPPLTPPPPPPPPPPQTPLPPIVIPQLDPTIFDRIVHDTDFSHIIYAEITVKQDFVFAFVLSASTV